MFPLYKHGNLDLYARKKRERDQSFDQTLRTWYKQLVSAVSSLVESNTYHGDIKLDNILISDSNELILIDFTRSSTTMAIASPEVKEGKRRLSTEGIIHTIYTIVNTSSHLSYRRSPDTAELANSKNREVRSILDRKDDFLHKRGCVNVEYLPQ